MIRNWLSLIFFLLSSGCSLPTVPSETPGRRDYLWTIDTIQMTVNHLSTMWGSSPTDIWAGGRGGLATDRLLHYDGHQWTPWKEPILTGVNALFGFAPDDVWLGGSDGRIWHFDGDHWTERFVYRPDGVPFGDIDAISGDGPDNIYAGGVIFQDDTTQRGFILHFDGHAWDEVYRANYYSNFGSVQLDAGIPYIWDIHFGLGASDTEFIDIFVGNTLRRLHSGVVGDAGHSLITQIGGQTYFILSHNVCRYAYHAQPLISGQTATLGSFVPVFSVASPYFSYGVRGRNISDAFLVMRDGLAHWNGSDVAYLVSYPPDQISGYLPVIFDRDIFFYGLDRATGASIVFHGTLRE